MPRPYRTINIGGKPFYEHRLVMERAVGRKLRTDEHVHHINGDGRDNRLANLELMPASEHQKEHHPRSFDVARLTRLLAEGKTFGQISKLMGKPYSTLQVAARALKLPYAHSQIERRKQRERVCETCGKPYLYQRGNRGRFCSYACAWKSSDRPFTCARCGKRAIRKAGDTARFCSPACYGLSKRFNREMRTCRTCGKRFAKRLDSAGHFCSRACYYKGYKLRGA